MQRMLPLFPQIGEEVSDAYLRRRRLQEARYLPLRPTVRRAPPPPPPASSGSSSPRTRAARSAGRARGRRQPGGSVHGERANFTVLVLFCVDASDSESRHIFHHFSRSTRCSLLRTFGVEVEKKTFAPLRIKFQKKQYIDY